MRVTLIRPILLSELGKWCGARLNTSDCHIYGISTNSSEVIEGDLFVALKGESFNGEDFIDEAIQKGARVLAEGGADTSLSTESTLTALLKIASEYKRRMLKALRYTVAITGSVGKTTVKEFTKSILSRGFTVHATEKNYNNAIGVALTMLSSPENTEVLICEMGMNHIGEIDELTAAVEPSIAVITNIGNAHIGNLGSREMIAKAKLEICHSPKLKTLILPYGEPLLSKIPYALTVSPYDSAADFFIRANSLTASYTTFDFYANKKLCFSGKCSISGQHILTSLAYAITIGYLLGIKPSEIADELKCFKEDRLRQRFQRVGRYSVYNDTYSSSPEAVIADIDMLNLDTKKYSAVLGDMLELGAMTEDLHKMIGKYAYEHGSSKLYTYGKYEAFIVEGALNAGMSEKNIFRNADPKDPKKTADQINESYDNEILLIKGSHALRMEKIIDELKKNER